MFQSSRLPDCCGEERPKELVELGRLIDRLPAQEATNLREAYDRVVECVVRRRRILSLVQEALAQLRLDVKYLMFDLEVTRKERDQFRSELDRIERDDRERY
jgi:hypothetical protein